MSSELLETSPRPPAAILIAALLAVTGCENPQKGASSETSSTASEATEPRSQSDDSESVSPSDDRDSVDDSSAADNQEKWTARRDAMVREQLEARDIDDEPILKAMREVRRHRFVPEPWTSYAYRDRALPIGHDQTISQPYIVARMTQALQVSPDHEVLEIGTGSGYQAAVLSALVDTVYSIEIVCELANRARETLDEYGYDNVEVTCGDGYEGWPEHAPFDRIIVTAAPPEIPEALVDQLEKGGRMVLPVGDRVQELKIVEKRDDGSIETVEMMKVRFVPMVHGDAGTE